MGLKSKMAAKGGKNQPRILTLLNSPGQLWYYPKQIATVLISFVSCTIGSAPPPKSPRDSEWWIWNYHGSKVKVSQSETRIQKWANKRCTYCVWCRFIGNCHALPRTWHSCHLTYYTTGTMVHCMCLWPTASCILFILLILRWGFHFTIHLHIWCSLTAITFS